MDNVYVIDDEETVRASLGKLLRAIGLEAETYASAEAFLGAYDGGDGCLLVDIRMPGMSGIDLLIELERRNSPLAAIVMTGHTEESSLRRLELVRTIGFLEKPFSVGQLKEVLARWREVER